MSDTQLEDYPYLTFIKNISNVEDIIYNNNKFKINFLYYLNENNLNDYFKNNEQIKYFDLNSFLIKTQKSKNIDEDINNIKFYKY